MVVDTSALMAVLFGEAEEPQFVSAIEQDPLPKLSAVSQIEATMVYLGRREGARRQTISELIDTLGLKVIGVDDEQTNRAIDAFVQYGKGRHPARLNLGDCFVYALTTSLNEPLLFKGDDFLKTDIVPAWRP